MGNAREVLNRGPDAQWALRRAAAGITCLWLSGNQDMGQQLHERPSEPRASL